MLKLQYFLKLKFVRFLVNYTFVAPACGSDESGSPVANRTRSRVNKAVIIKPSHFQSETAMASNDHAYVANESQSVGYTSSRTQLLLLIV